MNEHVAVLRERARWLEVRIRAKREIEWDVEWDLREYEALKWAITELEHR